MTAEPKVPDAILEAVADGSRIDWIALEAAAMNDTHRRRLLHLSVVARVAALTQGNRPLHEREPGGQRPPAVRQPVKRWGHLLLLEKIAEGTYADVYRGRDVWLDAEVAVKLLRRRSAEDLPVVRLLTEARALARVRHQHVVAIHGANIQDGRAGLWMEFIHGRTLEELLLSHGPFDARDAVRIGLHVCGAVSAVHDAGLVHGDIKADNVMQEAGGRVVLTDFGAGQLAGRARLDRPRAGSPLYLAPEVLNGGQTSIFSDIYAVGVLLHRLVIESFPVNASSLDELRAAHGRGEYHDLRAARPDLPDPFVAVVTRALNAEPSARYPTARAMGEALGSTL